MAILAEHGSDFLELPSHWIPKLVQLASRQQNSDNS